MPKQDWIDQFEQQGVRQVRERLGEWSGSVKAAAIEWLAQKDKEERLHTEASQAEQVRVARSANLAAWIAAGAAIIAAVAAIASIVLQLAK